VVNEDQFQLATYKKMPIAAERGEGVWIYASNGERYLDLYGGHAVAGTGHCHPHVVNALREQAGELLFYSNLVYSSARARAAEKLVSIAPGHLTKAFFCNSGTEANENAMRMARMATQRERVITFSGGFHGRTADAISATFLGKYREIGKARTPRSRVWQHRFRSRTRRRHRCRDHARADSVNGGRAHGPTAFLS
jgi:acetylornithine/succinyldiaminopimelate/putrescine aminotransferase